LSVSKDATVYANFVAQTPPPPAQVHLTATVIGPGAVTGAGLDCGESTKKCDVTLAGGSTVTLTASTGGGRASPVGVAPAAARRAPAR